MKRLLVMLGSLIVLLVAVILLRTLRYRQVQAAVPPAPDIAIADGAAERLAGAVRIATISHEKPADFDAASFQALHAYLATQFPQVHARLRRETVGTHVR